MVATAKAARGIGAFVAFLLPKMCSAFVIFLFSGPCLCFSFDFIISACLFRNLRYVSKYFVFARETRPALAASVRAFRPLMVPMVSKLSSAKIFSWRVVEEQGGGEERGVVFFTTFNLTFLNVGRSNANLQLPRLSEPPV